jgi:hypothetical protein
MLYEYKGYPLSAKIPRCEIQPSRGRFSRDLPVGDGVCLNGLFKQAVEKQAAGMRRPSIKAKDELVEVMV